MRCLESLTTLFARSFESEGRASRKEFAAYVLVGCMLALGLALTAIAFLYWLANFGDQFIYADELVAGMTTPGTIAFMFIWMTVAFLGGITMNVALIFASIRRLHDLALSGWWSLLYFVPIANLLGIVFLIFWPAREKAPASVGDLPTDRGVDA